VGQYQTPKEMGGIFQKRKWSCPYDRIILILAVQFLDEIKTQEAGRRRQPFSRTQGQIKIRKVKSEKENCMFHIIRSISNRHRFSCSLPPAYSSCGLRPVDGRPGCLTVCYLLFTVCAL
jgi:hypothetical protein